VSGYFSDLWTGAVSLLDGFAVTLKAMLSPVVTVQYPRERTPVPPGHRGYPRLVIEEDTGRPKCMACGSCARSCPSSCIAVEGVKKEGEQRKYPTLFQLDFTRCSQCATCVDVCPVHALVFTQDYSLAGFTREEFVFDLMRKY